MKRTCLKGLGKSFDSIPPKYGSARVFSSFLCFYVQEYNWTLLMNSVLILQLEQCADCVDVLCVFSGLLIGLSVLYIFLLFLHSVSMAVSFSTAGENLDTGDTLLFICVLALDIFIPNTYINLLSFIL